MNYCLLSTDGDPEKSTAKKYDVHMEDEYEHEGKSNGIKCNNGGEMV